MTTSDYDQISQALVSASRQHELLSIALDPAPYDPLKLSVKAYAFAINRLLAEIESLINITLCEDLILMIGGHSAGGASAINALETNLFTVPIAGYIGLDPYFVPAPARNVHQHIPVPSLLWGFATTTCGVNVDHSAKAAYLSAYAGFRVFYQLNSSSYSHCCFTDSGCLSVCSCGQNNQKLIHDVGVSVNQFTDLLQTNARFSRSDFPSDQLWLDKTIITIFMDEAFLTQERSFAPITNEYSIDGS